MKQIFVIPSARCILHQTPWWQVLHLDSDPGRMVQHLSAMGVAMRDKLKKQRLHHTSCN